MTTADSWRVEISLYEQDGKTRAEAGLAKEDLGMIGHGQARRNPHDQQVTQIGEEISAARALSDLAHQLLDEAARRIEGITHERAHLSV